MQYLAHNEDGKKQSYKEHTLGTAEYAFASGKQIGIGYISETIALIHDLGKLIDDFQTYLHMEEAERAKVKGTINHTSAGAKLLELWYGKDTNFSLTPNDGILVDMMSYTISAHHGLYDCVDSDGEDLFSKRLQKIDAQKVDELFSRWSEILGWGKTELDRRMMLAREEFQNTFLNALAGLKCQHHAEHFYAGCFERLLLSIQIDSDWTNTAMAMGEDIAEQQIGTIVFAHAWENYLHYMNQLSTDTDYESMPGREKMIRQLRGELQRECMEFASNGAGIYRLLLPTGGGKTLTSLGYALKMAIDNIEQGKESSHIFYISPYISIVEQNTRILKEAVGNEDWVFEHHSNVSHSDERKNQMDSAWKEPIISTTMVQFLNTLFSDKKKCIRRFHQLKNAIIIVDEVQSLPVKTIHTFNLMMNFLSRVCHATIILCSATQPTLDSEMIKRKILYSAPRDMVGHIDEIFEKFDRTQIICDFLEEKETMEDFGKIIRDAFSETQSILAIFNKRQTVADFYDKMCEELTDTEVFYLTTYICAEHRADNIQKIKELLHQKERKVLIISTNLIEAGVDLSVERVYRSIAGLDSIAQSAGRCNRNGEREKGKVIVFEMEGDEPGKGMDELIAAQGITKQIAYSYSLHSQKDSIISPKWMQRYYEIFYKELSNKKMDFNLKDQYKGATIYRLLSTGFKGGEGKHLLRQAFALAGREYNVIDQEGFTVLVPYKEGGKLINKIENSEDRRKAIENIRRAQRYTVSIREYEAEKLLEKGVIAESNILPEVYIARSYDKDKGLMNELPFVNF